MRLPQFSILIIILTSAFFEVSCNRNTVALQSTNAKGEVQPLGNLTFVFNKSLYPDSLLNNWDSTEFITFSPKIPGKFRWKNTDELVFSPADGLLPATDYTANINKDVLKFSKYNDINTDDIKFSTTPLKLEDAQVTWVLENDNSKNALPQVHLQFNYPVKAEDIKNKIKLQLDGKEMPVSFVSVGNNQEMIFRIQNVGTQDKDHEAIIRIDKGLIPAKGKNGTKEDLETILNIPSPYNLVINNVESEHDGVQGIVKIYTSQQITGNAAQYISLDPIVPFTTALEDNAIVLRSEKFDVNESYTFTIKSGLRGKIGGVLKEDYNGVAAFGQLESDVKFTNSKAVYLSKYGVGKIEVRITNTPKIKLIISKIYENNLLMAERYGYEPNDRNGENKNSDDEEYYSGENAIAGDIIYSKEIDTRSLPKSGAGRLLDISQFEDRLQDTKGIYHVMIRSSEDYWVRDSRFISYSDIGLIAKQGREKMFVFANSLRTAKPIQGVTIHIYGANNQLLGTGATDADGAVAISMKNKSFAGFRPAMVIAKTENDFTYLPFSSTKINTSRFEVGGKSINASATDAYIYAERDIYRPGEKVNFAVVLRDKIWKSPGEIPVKMIFLMPNGKELKSFRKILNEQGAVEGSVDISASAITGSYSLEIYSANDVLLSSKNFMIEEFVPDRIKVESNIVQSFLRVGDIANLQLTATNFFGPPASNRKYELEIQIKQKQFNAKKYPGYDFSLANQNSFFDKTVKEGITDEIGKASEPFTIPAIYGNSGLLQASFYATVFDETGRPVSKHLTRDIYTQNVFLGLKNDGYYYYALNQPANFQLLGVNKDAAPVNTTARIQVIKNEYRTVLTKSGGNNFRYESQQETKIISDKNISINGTAPFNFVPRTPGDYEIRLYVPGANAFVSKKFYSYGSWGSDNSNFEVNTEGNIDIESDKEIYQNGEKASILFKTPFSGRMLVTIENDGVVMYKYIDVSQRTATMELPMNGEHLPNIYVTATLFKPHQISDIPLTVAHGFKSIAVEEKKRKLKVEINASESVRSNTHQKIKVITAPGSYVSLAAVDNGVLQVSDFKTPDPYNYFYQKRALQVQAYDIYPLLFPELRTRLSSTGGDGGLNLDKRVNPMQAKRFKIMSYWSGLQKANGSGIAEFEFDIPQFNGQIRLMAVAFKDECFGSAEKNTTVADPLVLSNALPRFISPGDTVIMPINISNTTSTQASGEVYVNIKGPLKVNGNSKQNIIINAKSEARATFSMVAEQKIDIASITVTVKALNETFTEATEISIRPASTLQKISGSGSVNGGSNKLINVGSNDFISSSFSYDVIVSKSPMAEFGNQLKYLTEYPYGCTEQIISTAFPQLYYGDLATLFGKNQNKNSNVNVIEAIRKIKMRQLYNGALTLWDGEGTEHWWATIYAAHFLIEARKAGFDVDDSLLETMLAYISNKLKSKQTIVYYYNRDQNKKIAPKEVPYSLYVLSLAGRSQISSMNYYKANPQYLALDGKYLLSAAYALAGDKKSFTNLLPVSFNGEESVQETGGSFYSFLRDESIALNALMDVDPGNKQIPFMAGHVSQLLRSEKYPNTQERTFSLLALGKLARQAALSNVTADIRVNGKNIASVNGNWKANSSTLKSNNFEIQAKGSGRLYYTWIAEGISANGNYTEEDNYLKVRRRFYSRTGTPLSANNFKQNDLIIVEITLEKTFANPVQNIVVTDLLPAGFEIENPRTKEIPGMDWIKNASEPIALDVRDDRIHFFVDATTAKQKYYYAVRAVSMGTFKQGPVSADAMYNGEMHSYHGAQIITVIR